MVLESRPRSLRSCELGNVDLSSGSGSRAGLLARQEAELGKGFSY